MLHLCLNIISSPVFRLNLWLVSSQQNMTKVMGVFILLIKFHYIRLAPERNTPQFDTLVTGLRDPKQRTQLSHT